MDASGGLGGVAPAAASVEPPSQPTLRIFERALRCASVPDDYPSVPGSDGDLGMVFQFVGWGGNYTKAMLWQTCRDLCPPRLYAPRVYTALELQRRLAEAVHFERSERELALTVKVRHALEGIEWQHEQDAPLATRIDEFESCLLTLVEAIAPAELGHFGFEHGGRTDVISTFASGALEQIWSMDDSLRMMRRVAEDEIRRLRTVVQNADAEIDRLRTVVRVRDEALAMIGSRSMSGTATPTAIAQMCGDAAAGYDIVDMECWLGEQDGEGAGGIPPMDNYRA